MDFRTLVDAWRAGTLSRRAFLERAAALGGLQKYVEFTPNAAQNFEIRKFNFHMRRA